MHAGLRPRALNDPAERRDHREGCLEAVDGAVHQLGDPRSIGSVDQDRIGRTVESWRDVPCPVVVHVSWFGPIRDPFREAVGYRTQPGVTAAVLP